MTDRESLILGLLRGAICAGVAPAAVAEWGRAGEDSTREILGASTLAPERVEAAADTWFDLASLTKPLVTTTLTLIAFRGGSINPSTRAGEVLDELRGTDVGNLEVDALLTHTSGLPAWLPLYCLAEGRPELLPSRLARVSLEARSGERVVYSCVGFVILGLMLARVAGETLDAMFRREVLAVLGLEGQLGFNPELDTQSLVGGAGKSLVENRLVSELGLDLCWIPSSANGLPDDGNARFLDGVAGNAGLFGTAGGVLALTSEYLPGGGSLLTAEEAERSTSIRTAGLEQGRGWGWQLANSPGCSAGPALSATSFGHTGFTGVSVWCDPATRGVFILLTNRNHPVQRENDLHPLRRRFHALAAKTMEEQAPKTL
jgi:CubicO group peptidase (beta-lactamase class C family)